jgi:hypothetical protein
MAKNVLQESNSNLKVLHGHGSVTPFLIFQTYYNLKRTDMECEDRRCERMEKSVLNNKLSPVNYRSRYRFLVFRVGEVQVAEASSE